MRKSNIRLDLTSGFTALFSVVFWASSILSSLGLRKLFPSFDGLPLFLILLAAFAVACAVNRVSAKVFARQHFGMHPDERRKLLDTHVEKCKQDPTAVLAEYRDMEALPLFLLILYFVLVFAMGASAPLCILPDCGVPRAVVACAGMMLAGFFGFMPIWRLCQQIPERLNKDHLVPTGYLPMLEAMANKAAAEVGIRGPVRLAVIRECEIDVNRISGTYVVLLGSRLLSVLTEEEVYQCLLMNFDYFTHPKEYREITRRYRLGLLGSSEIRRETFAFDLFFSYADVTLEWEYDFYTVAFKHYLSRCSYDRVKQAGNPRPAVNALCKWGMWRFFVFESNSFITTPFYAEPAPHKHYERDVCNAFRHAIFRRHRVWLDMQNREMHPTGNMDPVFRDAWQYLDPDGREPLEDSEILDIDLPYGQEVAKAIKQRIELRVYNEVAPTYEAAREAEYLEPLRAVEAYEADPAGYTTPELSPVINAYRDICRYDKAEAICDEILETETNQFALAHALYFKGMCMLHRYETEGIDLIYRAIDLNKNYMKDGFEMVEEYCTMCGLADEYEHFFRRAITQMSAHAYNHDSAGELTPRDHLVKEEELGDMLPDILAYMEQVSEGCIREIYLVRKVISEDFFTSAFVLNFEYNSDREAIDRAYTAIFNYLDAYPVDWQFSLFLYNRETEAAVRQVEGSLIWKKTDRP